MRVSWSLNIISCAWLKTISYTSLTLMFCIWIIFSSVSALSLIRASSRKTVCHLNCLHTEQVEMVHRLFQGAWYHVATYTIWHNSGFASIAKLNPFGIGLCDWLDSNILDVSSADAIVYVDITEDVPFQGLLQLHRVFRYRQQFECM